MKKIDVKDMTTVAFEGLEQRQFFSTAPLMHFAPPAFGDGTGMPTPIVFDAAFAAGRFPQGTGIPVATVDNQTSVATSPLATSAPVAPTPAFNGYPTTDATVATSSTASASMELVNRAVDGAYVGAETVRSENLSVTVRTDSTVATTATPTTEVAVSPSTATAAATLPDGQIVHPTAVFSSEPIRSDVGATGVSAITASLGSAEEQIACVVRLAWADVAYTNVGQSIGRLATEAGQALSRNAADAELAAALVMGVAGAAWWVNQVEDDVAEKKVEADHHWIEIVYPRPMAG